MLEQFVNKILALAPTQILDIYDRKYTSARVLPVNDPEVTGFNVQTLTGFTDYINKFAGKDEVDLKDVIVNVESFKSVRMQSKLFGDFKQRNEYLLAKCKESDFSFDYYCDVESFIIALQAHFEETDHLKTILKIVGNLKESAVKTNKDDGITQTVTTKHGISMAEEIDLPNPVSLKPYRTFLEVAQPESTFVFRMKGGRGDFPTCALHAADGGRWKLEAAENIKKWLAENLPEEVVIIA